MLVIQLSNDHELDIRLLNEHHSDSLLPELHGDPVEVPELEPGRVRAGDEEVDHGAVAAVQEVSPQAAATHCRHGVEHGGHGEQAGQHSAVHQAAVQLGGAPGIGDHQPAQPD